MFPVFSRISRSRAAAARCRRVRLVEANVKGVGQPAGPAPPSRLLDTEWLGPCPGQGGLGCLGIRFCDVSLLKFASWTARPCGRGRPDDSRHDAVPVRPPPRRPSTTGTATPPPVLAWDTKPVLIISSCATVARWRLPHLPSSGGAGRGAGRKPDRRGAERPWCPSAYLRRPTTACASVRGRPSGSPPQQPLKSISADKAPRCCGRAAAEPGLMNAKGHRPVWREEGRDRT